MGPFYYKDDILYCEDVSIFELTSNINTPFYLYSQKKLESNADTIKTALNNIDSMICYALKANGNPYFLKYLYDKGYGAEVVSGGELELALKVGIPSEKILFSGVGKTDTEIAKGIDHNIYCFNVESIDELQNISAIATQKEKTANIAIRVNPDIDPNTHPYIATGLKESKFGIEIDEAVHAYQMANSLPGLEIMGVHCHIGSMIMEINPYIEAAKTLSQLINSLKWEGIVLKHIDIGGGLGVHYDGIVENNIFPTVPQQTPPSPEKLFSAVFNEFKDMDLKFIFEPGRFLTANTGALISRVIITKTNGYKKFIVIDAGMNDLIRPSLYDAYHQIVPVKIQSTMTETYSIVGPICESGDFFAIDRQLPRMKRHDLLAVMATGAYGYVLASNYNGRPRPAEILVDGSNYHTIRKRESIEDLWKNTTFD